MYTPQEGLDGMLLERYGKLTMWKSKSSRLQIDLSLCAVGYAQRAYLCSFVQFLQRHDGDCTWLWDCKYDVSK